MNKGYTYIDGKVVVSDDQGNQRQIDYYDNLEEVLVEENIIEELYQRLGFVNDLIAEHECDRKNRKPLFLIAFAILILAIVGIDKIAFNSSISFSTLFGVIGVGLPMTALFDYYLYCKHKEKTETLNRFEDEKEIIKLQIEQEKEKLHQLEENKTRNNEDLNNKSVNIDYREKLEKIREFIRSLKYHTNDYYELYEKGLLEEALGIKYGKEGLEVVKQFLDEQGPKLTRKK